MNKKNTILLNLFLISIVITGTILPGDKLKSEMLSAIKEGVDEGFKGFGQEIFKICLYTNLGGIATVFGAAALFNFLSKIKYMI